MEKEGFLQVKLSSTNYVLVRIVNNRVAESSSNEIIKVVREHLENIKESDVYEAFARGSVSFTGKSKLNLLKSIEMVDDLDGKDNSHFFFKNCFCKVTKDKIIMRDFQDLKFEIWENRIIKREFNYPIDNETGQFEQFIKNISNNSGLKLYTLKTVIGYLLHRNKSRENKAIILYDEKMGLNGQANGGTGKTLLSQAINECREVVLFDGKDIKTGSWFKNQRINLTTDITVYDDLNRMASLELFFSMITSGVEVEKKRQQSFFIDKSRSPKIVITSNYYVNGPGGSSDQRRRFEFELANHYDAYRTPETEFGNMFFDKDWPQEEWNRFYFFMMECCQLYLNQGLVVDPTSSFIKSKVEAESCKEFVQFSNKYLILNEWTDKRRFKNKFEETYPDTSRVSPHMFTKWIESYSNSIGGSFKKLSTGGDYNFIVRKEDGNGK